MKEVEYIVGIYNNYNPTPEDPSMIGYYFLYLLDQKGLLDIDDARKIFMDKYNLNEMSDALKMRRIGPFESVDVLNQFAFHLCEQLNAEKISLLSVQEYNSLLEANQSAQEFHNELLEKGNVIQNIERKKKGFLSRIFN